MRAAKVKVKGGCSEIVSFRASAETKAKAQAIQELMKVASTSQMIRHLLEKAAKEYGVA